MLYGLLTNSIFPLFSTYAIGECLAILYIAVYTTFTDKEAHTLKAVGLVACFVALLSVYTVLGWQGVLGQSAYDAGQVIGFIGIGVVIVLYASPFETLRLVLRTKDASSMPILMCIAGTISNGLWTIYGFLVSDMLVAIPNVVCVIFGLVQVVLYALYRPRCNNKLELPHSVETIPSPTFEYVACANGGG